MNTQVLTDNLHNQYLAQIESKTVAFPLVNMALQPGLLEQGDTTIVKYMNNIDLDTAASSGEIIPTTDWVELSDTLVVDQVKNKNFKIKDIERIRGNLDEQMKLTELIVNASARNLDKYALATAVAGAGTVLNSGTPVTLDVNTVIDEIEAMRVTLDEAGLEADNEQYLFVDAKRASLLRKSKIYDNTERGLTVRQKAFIGEYAGFMIYQSNHIPTADAGVNTYMVAMDTNSVHGAEQMNKFKVTTGQASMSDNILYENVYGMNVLGLNSARIVANKITVA